MKRGSKSEDESNKANKSKEGAGKNPSSIKKKQKKKIHGETTERKSWNKGTRYNSELANKGEAT